MPLIDLILTTKGAQMPATRKSTVLLAILDGWGLGAPVPSNAVHVANTPAMDGLMERYPHTTLRCSGEDVGLPDGQMGNSEVGHLNIGAGHIVFQSITRIDRAIRDGSFATNETLVGAFERARANGGTVHLCGLVSDGGVHSHIRHLTALIELASRFPTVRVRIHAFTDGRDTAPESGLGFIRQLEQTIADSLVDDIEIASLCGRYYAMDRDHRWQRTQKAFEVVTAVGGPSSASASEAVSQSYANNVTDEFLEPVRIGRWGEPGNTMHRDDQVIFFNFRSDRARQLSEALTRPAFDGFDRGATAPTPVEMVTLTQYEASLPAHVAYPPHDIAHPIARVVSDAGMTQLHTAETEKYPHVTFFLNGGREAPFPGEDRVLVPSPKVATYDLQPEMSAPAVCDAVVNGIASGKYDFIIVNFANPDMVGHTGDIGATIVAVETVDQCLGRVMEALLAANGMALVTADHGNAECLRVPGTDDLMTAHTTNPVPIILVTPEQSPYRAATLRPDGRLSAIAPTIVELLGLPPHPDMTEPGLLQNARPG